MSMTPPSSYIPPYSHFKVTVILFSLLHRCSQQLVSASHIDREQILSALCVCVHTCVCCTYSNTSPPPSLFLLRVMWSTY